MIANKQLKQLKKRKDILEKDIEYHQYWLKECQKKLKIVNSALERLGI